MSDHAEELRSAMSQAGIDYCGKIHDDGKLHRIKATGDHHRNSWYVLVGGDLPAGKFGCWKRSFTEIWHAELRLTQSQRDEIRQKRKLADQERQKTDAEIKAAARVKAQWIYSNSARPDASHPYLVAKKVQAHGELRQYEGSLLLPLRDIHGSIHSAQFIDATGTKRFLRGGRIAGCFFVLADVAGPLAIAEGYATAATVHEATGYAAIAAMNAGNLLETGRALRAKYPERELIVCGDNDTTTPGNPGVRYATETARAIRAKLAVPQFQPKETF